MGWDKEFYMTSHVGIGYGFVGCRVGGVSKGACTTTQPCQSDCIKSVPLGVGWVLHKVLAVGKDEMGHDIPAAMTTHGG